MLALVLPLESVVQVRTQCVVPGERSSCRVAPTGEERGREKGEERAEVGGHGQEVKIKIAIYISILQT